MCAGPSAFFLESTHYATDINEEVGAVAEAVPTHLSIDRPQQGLVKIGKVLVRPPTQLEKAPVPEDNPKASSMQPVATQALGKPNAGMYFVQGRAQYRGSAL
jgi:hypothetical protein